MRHYLKMKGIKISKGKVDKFKSIYQLLKRTDNSQARKLLIFCLFANLEVFTHLLYICTMRGSLGFCLFVYFEISLLAAHLHRVHSFCWLFNFFRDLLTCPSEEFLGIVSFVCLIVHLMIS